VREPLRVLILGGTQFVGVHLTQMARQRGHVVTLFHRGQTNPDWFPEIERLKGDRDGGLESLRGRTWDAVIDTSAYIPRHARITSELLAPCIRRYLFVSTILVYADFVRPNDEDSVLAALPDRDVEHVDLNTYGPLKVACERVLHEVIGERLTVVRPGYIAGPYDHTDRFTYWPARAARGGDMIAPGTPDNPMQIIDVRDMARFVLDALENDLSGTFNLVRPPGLTIGRVIDASVEVARSLAGPSTALRPIWIAADFLGRYTSVSIGANDFPLWHPPTGSLAGFAQVSAVKALKAGLAITPIGTTVHDCLSWHLARPGHPCPQAGISPDREQEILAAWRQFHPQFEA
jgi:2'-hydroxyisoflavone reductase